MFLASSFKGHVDVHWKLFIINQYCGRFSSVIFLLLTALATKNPLNISITYASARIPNENKSCVSNNHERQNAHRAHKCLPFFC